MSDFDDGLQKVLGGAAAPASAEAEPQAGEEIQEEIQEKIQEEVQEEVQGETQGETLEEEEPRIAGLTETELKNILAEAQGIGAVKARLDEESRKIYGKFGEIQQKLDKATSARGEKITADRLARTVTDFPELAEMLAEDLSGLVLSPASYDPSDLERSFNEKLAESVENVTRAMEKKILTLAHPDWEKKTATADYPLWLGTLPQERRDEIANSWDGLFLASQLDEFDKWRGAAKPKKKPRLEGALPPPSGTAAPKPHGADPFTEGLNKVLKRQR